jgi:hypothetical protein
MLSWRFAGDEQFGAGFNIRVPDVSLPLARSEKRVPVSLPARRTRTRSSLVRLKGEEALRQIDFGDWWGRAFFPNPA